jgi:hypothetical protein
LEDVSFAGADIPRNAGGSYPAEKLFPEWKEQVAGITLIPTEGE